MRRASLARLVFAVAILTLAAGAFAASTADRVILANRSGGALTGVFISPVGGDDWEDNVLAPDVLPDGARMAVLLDGYGPQECRFDVKVINEAAEAWVLRDVNLCGGRVITVAGETIMAQ